LRLVASVFLALAVGSYVMALAFPAIGVMGDPHPGAWAGLWWEKNTLGSMMTRGVIACLSAAALDRKYAMVWTAGAVLSAGLVILCTSRTSLLTLGACTAMAGLILVIRRGPFIAVATVWAGTAIAAALIGLIALAPDLALGLIGRDMTLTGRADLWAVLWPLIQERLATGYGYGAFWLDPDGPAISVRRILDWPVPTAHNGWIEVMLGLGLGGAVLFALQCLLSLALAVRRLSDRCIATPWWTIVMPMGFLMVSLSESAIFQHNDLSWVLFVATAAKLALPDDPCPGAGVQMGAIETRHKDRRPEHLSGASHRAI
jgi:O-antigen ligase